MAEQITYYHDALKISPYCQRVEIALLETGASYTPHALDIYNKPEWFAQVNPLTGKVPTITYGGPDVHPEKPSPESFKLVESYVILEFLADLFPKSTLLPPTSDPTARARVRLFMDIVHRSGELPAFDFHLAKPGAFENLIQGLEKVQALLPSDPDTEGPYAMGNAFTNADCAVAPVLAIVELTARTDLGRFEPGVGTKLGEAFAEKKFERLRQYKNALWERESVKKVIDIDALESAWVGKFGRH